MLVDEIVKYNGYLLLSRSSNVALTKDVFKEACFVGTYTPVVTSLDLMPPIHQQFW
jgi:hypothetical protein